VDGADKPGIVSRAAPIFRSARTGAGRQTHGGRGCGDVVGGVGRSAGCFDAATVVQRGSRVVARGPEVAQAGAAALEVAAQMTDVGADQVALDLAVRRDAVRDPGRPVRGGAQQDEDGGRDARTGRSARFASERLEAGGFVLVSAALGEQPHRAAPGEAEQGTFRPPLAVAGVGIERVRALAGLAARAPTAGGPIRLVAPRRGVAPSGRRLEQLARRRPVFAERVLHDFQPELALEPARLGGLGLGRRLGRARGRRIGQCRDEALVEALERGQEPAQQAARVWSTGWSTGAFGVARARREGRAGSGSGSGASGAGAGSSGLGGLR